MGKISKSYLKELAEKKKYKSGGFSTEGYKRNSPDVNNPYNVIPSNQITMKGVDFPVMGIDDLGHQQMMYPGNNYTFPGNYVTEFPVKNMGNKRFGQAGFQNRGEISTEKSPIELPYVEIKAKRNPLAGVKPLKREPGARSPLAKNAQPQDQLRTQYYRKPEEQMAGISETKKEDLRRKISGVLRETTQADKDWAAEQANRKALTFSGASDGSVLGGMLDLVNPFSYYYAGKDAVRGAGETIQAIYEGNPDAVAAGLFKTGLNAAAFLPATQVGKFANAIGTEARLINRLKPLSVQRNLGDISKEAYKSLGRKAYQEAAKNPFNVSEYLTQGPLKNAFKELPGSSSKFKSEIDWGKWNKRIPNKPGRVKEYNAIEEATKKAGTWMKNSDGTPFTLPDGSPGTAEQFVQSQSANFKKAFPEGYDLTYRGAQVYYPTLGMASKSGDDFANINPDYVLFGIENPSIAERYATNHGYNLNEFFQEKGIHPPFFHPDINKTIAYNSDIFASNPAANAGLYGYATPKNVQKLVSNANKERWMNVENSEVREWLKKTKPEEYNLRTTIHENWLPDKVTTDDIAKYIKEKNIPIAEIKNVHDGADYFGNFVPSNVRAVNRSMVNPKSLWYNDGDFDLSNPDAFGAILPYAIPTGLGIGALQNYYNQKPKGTYQMGGTIGMPRVNGQVVSSGPQPLTSVKKTRGPISKDTKGDVKTMPTKAVKKILKNLK